jgi:predicted nucleic acid-binding protein
VGSSGLRSISSVEPERDQIEVVDDARGLSIEDLRLDDLLKASYLMKECDLDYEDSLHHATALRANAKQIVSNDKDFDKTPLRRAFQ